MNPWTIFIIFLIIVGGGVFIFNQQNQFDLPSGVTERFTENDMHDNQDSMEEGTMSDEGNVSNTTPTDSIARVSEREVLITDGVKHSIPLNEILSGGPPKDGIPSIDDPKFLGVRGGNEFLSNDEVGLGIVVNGDARFYPYQVLVWHEIVNDTVGDEPILVTYCPLCATGIVFDRRVDGEVQEFGVSGRLWQSNLLMYNRANREADESLWSQVLGEAVLGVNTGEKLDIVRSSTVLYGDWKKEHPDTKVLSRDTGHVRAYGTDPYEGYYTNNTVSFGATFNDDRLHPKAYVLGIEIDGKFKAYEIDAIPVGESTDTFQGQTITINKSNIDAVTMEVDGKDLPYVGGFWFSWLAVHPDTELFK